VLNINENIKLADFIKSSVVYPLNSKPVRGILSNLARHRRGGAAVDVAQCCETILVSTNASTSAQTDRSQRCYGGLRQATRHKYSVMILFNPVLHIDIITYLTCDANGCIKIIPLDIQQNCEAIAECSQFLRESGQRQMKLLVCQSKCMNAYCSLHRKGSSFFVQNSERAWPCRAIPYISLKFGEKSPPRN
jgi:hypothetical protein